MLHRRALQGKADAALAEGRGVASMTSEEFAGFMIRCGGIDSAIESLSTSVGLMRTNKMASEFEPVGLSFVERALRVLQDARHHDETFDPYTEDPTILASASFGPGEPVLAPPDEEVGERFTNDPDSGD